MLPMVEIGLTNQSKSEGHHAPRHQQPCCVRMNATYYLIKVSLVITVLKAVAFQALNELSMGYYVLKTRFFVSLNSTY